LKKTSEHEQIKTQKSGEEGQISKIGIYPSIGIARIGNHPSKYYTGLEAPGIAPDVGPSFKEDGLLKPQAAR
jgi:hypothetical protein